MYKKIGIALAVLNFLAVVNSMNFFFNMAKASFLEWIFFNACAPSVILFLIGYLSRRKAIMYMSIPALAFFGGGGLFVFGWTGGAFITQIGHVFMVSAVIWMIYGIIKEQNYKEAVVGLLLAAVFVNAFIAVQQKYAYTNWIRLQQMMNYNPQGQVSYEGVLPGADCAGLKTELTLYNDNTYFLKETYLATRDGDKVFTSFGKWRKLKNGKNEVIQLNYDKPQESYNFMITGSDKMEVIDKELRKISSPFNMTLTRKR